MKHIDVGSGMSERTVIEKTTFRASIEHVENLTKIYLSMIVIETGFDLYDSSSQRKLAKFNHQIFSIIDTLVINRWISH